MEVPYLRYIGLFSNDSSYSNTKRDYSDIRGSRSVLSKILKSRLTMFLQVFAAVTSPKQLYQHQLLYQYYLELLSKSDIHTVKLAMECILTYKPIYVTPYKDNIMKLLSENSLRNELISFDLSEENGILLKEHREEFIPLIIKVVFGRFVSKARNSKAAREQANAR